MEQDSEKKVKRLLRLYDRLHTGRRIYPPELASEYGVSLRSLQRDLADMQAANMPITKVNVDGRQHYALASTAKKVPLNLGLSDVIVVMLSLRMMEQYQGTGLTGYMADLAVQIGDRLNEAVSNRTINLKRKLYALQPFPRDFSEKQGAVDDVLSALVYDNKLKLKYESLAGSTRDHVVMPYCLFCYKSGLYLVAMVDRPKEKGVKVEQRGPTVFALERIKSCERLKSETFKPPKNWDPGTFLPQWGGLLPGQTQDIQIEFDPKLRVYLKNLRWPCKCKLTRTADGKLLLKGAVNVSEEFINWLIGFGASARILGPDTLIDKVKIRLSETLAQYR